MQESLQARPNSHELFGYDFVVDQALNVWLIEVNCSPSLEHSTPVTACLCAQMMDDLFKVQCILPAPSSRALAPGPQYLLLDAPVCVLVVSVQKTSQNNTCA